jgi:hypothetical protein
VANSSLEVSSNALLEFAKVTLRFPWEDWKKVHTRLGLRLVRKAEIPHPNIEFWNEWKANRSALRRAGFTVTNFNEKWILTESRAVAQEEDAIEPDDVAFFYSVPKDIELPASIEQKLLSYQPDSVKRLIAAMRKYGSALDGSDMGTGKCLKKGTQVIMFDGTLKKVEDVVVGDYLMGDDSSGRKVLSTTKGIGQLYKVQPVKGEAWFCNENHILSLRYTSTTGRKCDRENGDIVDLEIKNYLNLGIRKKGLLKQYRVGIELPDKNIPYDPYIYGLWIADGGWDTPIFHKPECNAAKFWCNYFSSLGFRIYVNETKEKCKSWSVRNAKKRNKNEFTEFIRTSVINKKKFIREVYLLNSREKRLKLLAGIVDGDGHISNGGCEICVKSEFLADQIAYLARSLGFACYKKIKTGVIKKIAFSGKYFRLFISGDLSVIPTLDKIAHPRKQKKEVSNTGIKVTQDSIGEYYGFSIEGNHRFLLSDFTVTHNSYVAIAMCKYFNWRPAIISPKAVLTAWYRCCKFMGVQPIMIQNYENIRFGNTPYGGWKTKDIHRKDGTVEKRYTFTWFGIPHENTVFIFDEIQNTKNPTSKNCKLGLAAIREGYKILGCSGTIAENPTEMRFSGQLAGLHKGGDFYHWMLSKGVVKSSRGFIYRGGKGILSQICRQIYPEHGTRLRKVDLPDFPDCDIKAEAYDCGQNTKKIENVYNTMFANIAIIEESGESRQQKAILTQAERMRARQEAEMLKISALVETAKNAIENNLSVAIFTNFKETLYKLSELLKTTCVIHGDQQGNSGARARQACIDDFQADRERIIIVNIKSGGAGIGLHDIHGKYARISYICPSWSVYEMEQATGRIHRAGAKSKAIERIFYAAGTIEEEICERVSVKLANLNSLRDADLSPAWAF